MEKKICEIKTIKLDFDKLTQTIKYYPQELSFFYNSNGEVKLTKERIQKIHLFLSIFLLDHVHINRDRHFRRIYYSSNYFKKISRDYNKYLFLLKKSGLIKATVNQGTGAESYCNGKENSFTKSYRLTQYAWEQNIINFTLEKASDIRKHQDHLNHILKIKKDHKQTELSKQQGIDAEILTIDEKQLMNDCEHLAGLEKIDWNHHIISAHIFNNCKDYYHMVDKNGRLYNRLSFLNGDLLKYLRGERITEIDLKSSQLQFFATELDKIPNKSYSTRIFIKLIRSGKIYKFLMMQLKAANQDYKKFKKQFFKEIFYAKNSERYRLAKQFKRLFGQVYDYILTKKEKDYREFPNELMGVEAEFMINGLYKSLKMKFPNKFIVTKHDALLITSDIQMEAEKMLIELYKKQYETEVQYEVEAVNFNDIISKLIDISALSKEKANNLDSHSNPSHSNGLQSVSSSINKAPCPDSNSHIINMQRNKIHPRFREQLAIIYNRIDSDFGKEHFTKMIKRNADKAKVINKSASRIIFSTLISFPYHFHTNSNELKKIRKYI